MEQLCEQYSGKREGFMRIRDDFTVFPREMASGKVIWYYQTYDEEGRRTVAHSTGESTRTGAIKKCNSLMREGKLVSDTQVRIPTFAEYAQGWWDPEQCLYLKKRLSRKSLARTYVLHSRRVMEQYLIPYFGKKRLDRITEEEIDTWLVNYSEWEAHKGAPGRGVKKTPLKLKASTANVIFGILRLMLRQAVKRHIIPFNPADNVERLPTEAKQVEILTVGEFKEMTKPKPHVSLEGNAIPELSLEARKDVDLPGMSLEVAKMANFLAACTGMRIGEVLGVKGECVFADFIRVQGQYGVFGYGPTKTRKSRNIPLTPAIMAGLRGLVEINGNGYIFSVDGGVKPISRYYFTKYLRMALEGIGIDEEEKKKRNLTPHAWRYFLNTNLRARGIADAKVQSITGHQSQSMTEKYTRFYNEEFTDVRTIQDTLLLPDGRD
jgi:integrase